MFVLSSVICTSLGQNVCLCAEVISLSVYILSNLVCVYAFSTVIASIKQFNFCSAAIKLCSATPKQVGVGGQCIHKVVCLYTVGRVIS